MTKKTFIELTEDEDTLIHSVLEAEQFRDTCWMQYGPDWTSHIPTAVNAFIWYYFGTQAFPWQLAVYYSPQKEITVHGGRGCVAGWTLLRNADTGEQVPIAEIDSPFPVIGLTKNGIARVLSEVPFKKGEADLWRVTLTDGKSVTVTDQHRFLTRQGWKSIDQIGYVVGVEIAIAGDEPPHPRQFLPSRLPSMWGTDLPVHLSNARRYWNIESDFLGHYPEFHLGRDVLPHWAISSDQALFPLQDGSLLRNQQSWHRGGLGSEPRRSGLSQLFGHPAKRDWQNPGKPHRSQYEKYQDEPSYDVLPLDSRPDPDPYGLYPYDGSQEAIDASLHLGEEVAEPYSASNDPSVLRWQRICKVEHVGFGPYYDLHVPVINNYLAKGIYHHNSGKTVGIALLQAAYHTLHPGEPWLHVSPVKDQAARTFEAIRDFGSSVHDRPNFMERFVDDFPTAPYPEIRLKRWGPTDPGSVFRFRPLGDDNIEYLRSMEAAVITVDEAFREVDNPQTYPQLRGVIRGINRVKLAGLPLELRTKIENLFSEISMETDPVHKRILQDQIRKYSRANNLDRRGAMILYGNAGPWDWEWERHDKGFQDMKHWWSLTVTTLDNPTLGEQNVDAMREMFGDDDALVDVEMFAQRPRNLGDMYSIDSIDLCTDNGLLEDARDLARRLKVPGWIVEEAVSYGVYHYEEPAEEGHVYITGADPGTGVCPARNKWVIVTFDITTAPARLVYFRMGHLKLREAGDITRFWTELRYIRDHYAHLPGDIWIESTAQQRGMAQLAMPADIAVTPVTFVGQKIELLNKLREVLNRHLISYPKIPRLVIELGNFKLPDTDITQDIVMALICATGALWRIIRKDWTLHPIIRGPQLEEMAGIGEDRWVRTEER